MKVQFLVLTWNMPGYTKWEGKQGEAIKPKSKRGHTWEYRRILTAASLAIRRY
jgi:hypothetical protein